MQLRYFFLTILLFLVSEDFGFAQQSTERKWTLPEGTIEHLGDGGINDIAYSPDGGLLAVAGVNGIWLYDTQNGREVAQYPRNGIFQSVSFSPDGKTLAGGISGWVGAWDVATGTLLGRQLANNAAAISFSPDSQMLAFTDSWRTYISLWVINRPPWTLTKYRDTASLSFSPDGSMLAGGTSTGEVYLCDVATGRVRRTFEGHTDSVLSVAFSPSGLILASAGLDQTVRLWNVITGALRHTLEGHTFDVNSVSFRPDGKILASAGDQTVRLWNVITGKHLRTLHGHTGWVNSVSFSPDGKTLASAGSDGKILLWSVGWPAADVNRDDKVNIQDLVIIAGEVGHIGETDADVNGDGIVDIRDLVIVAGAFGEVD